MGKRVVEWIAQPGNRMKEQMGGGGGANLKVVQIKHQETRWRQPNWNGSCTKREESDWLLVPSFPISYSAPWYGYVNGSESEA